MKRFHNALDRQCGALGTGFFWGSMLSAFAVWLLTVFGFVRWQSPLPVHLAVDLVSALLGLFCMGLAWFAISRSVRLQAVADSESRFRGMVEQAVAGIYVFQDGGLCYVNPVFAGIFGFESPHDVIGKLVLDDLVAPEDRQRIQETIRLSLSHEVDRLQFTFTGIHCDGRRIEIEVHSRVFAYQGRPAIIGLIMDISARKVAETQLRISEERLKLALDGTSDGLWDWDLKSELAYLSPRYYQIIGYRPGQIRPDRAFLISLVHPDHRRHVYESLEGHLRGETDAIRCEFQLMTAQGETRWVRMRGQVVARDQDGKPTRMIGTLTDITEHKESEATLLRQSTELAQRNAELERFNQAMVGRELDMIALKQQVNALNVELGRQPTYPLSFLDPSPDLAEHAER